MNQLLAYKMSENSEQCPHFSEELSTSNCLFLPNQQEKPTRLGVYCNATGSARLYTHMLMSTSAKADGIVISSVVVCLLSIR